MQVNLKNIISLRKKQQKPNTFAQDFKEAQALLDQGDLKEAKKVVDRMRSVRTGKRYHEIVQERYSIAAAEEKQAKAQELAAKRAEKAAAAAAKKAAAESKKIEAAAAPKSN